MRDPSRVLVAAITVIPLAAWIVNSQNCHQERLYDCLESIQSITEGFDLLFPTTEKELEEACNQLRDGLSCADDFIHECFGKAYQTVYQLVVSSAKELVQDLCHNGSLQAQLLSLGECLGNSTSLARECSDTLEEGLIALRSGNAWTGEDALNTSCSSFGKFVHCRAEAVKSRCGCNASTWIHYFFVRLGGPLIEVHCSPFLHAGNYCDGTESETDPTSSDKPTELPVIVQDDDDDGQLEVIDTDTEDPTYQTTTDPAVDVT